MRKLSTLGFALLLAGCASLKPDYTKPAVDLPAGWRDAPADGVQARDARWWKVYGDPVLDRLVDEALAHNANVVLAIARVDEARAALSLTSAHHPDVGRGAGLLRAARVRRAACRHPALARRPQRGSGHAKEALRRRRHLRIRLPPAPGGRRGRTRAAAGPRAAACAAGKRPGGAARKDSPA